MQLASTNEHPVAFAPFVDQTNLRNDAPYSATKEQTMNKGIIALLAIGAMYAPLTDAHAANSLDVGEAGRVEYVLDGIITAAQEKAGLVLCLPYSTPDAVSDARITVAGNEEDFAKPGYSDFALIYYATVRMYVDDAAARGVDVVCGAGSNLVRK
ncbi:hypothetical protein [Rhizobium laguerreae]|uniref:hypothetical protein n=1 Tax=Rhizobium laguerreae TaxID=1076926 RepID=UPI001C9265C1|nr:hypothetical protein [Rhizobium laguerreae]MBY3194252.1 hypothetical protein [Rhizobium laguerreae]